jgi:hypothetical protein
MLRVSFIDGITMYSSDSTTSSTSSSSGTITISITSAASATSTIVCRHYASLGQSPLKGPSGMCMIAQTYPSIWLSPFWLKLSA